MNTKEREKETGRHSDIERQRLREGERKKEGGGKQKWKGNQYVKERERGAGEGMKG